MKKRLIIALFSILSTSFSTSLAATHTFKVIDNNHDNYGEESLLIETTDGFLSIYALMLKPGDYERLSSLKKEQCVSITIPDEFIKDDDFYSLDQIDNIEVVPCEDTNSQNSIQNENVPNLWMSGFGQGITEYLITNEEQVTLNISCDSIEDSRRSVFINLRTPNPALGEHTQFNNSEAKITLVTEGEMFPIPTELGARSADNAWSNFIGAINQAQEFEIYVGSKKVASYKAFQKNREKVLGEDFIETCDINN